MSRHVPFYPQAIEVNGKLNTIIGKLTNRAIDKSNWVQVPECANNS